MHAPRPGAGPARTKLLYMFRSPSHVQIGRKPLDPEVREALEHTHPDLTFDWNGLLRDSPAPARQPRTDPHDPRDRANRGRTARGQKPARTERPAPPRPEVPEDDSALGQALGAVEAARLRQRYAELVQRVGRRARTPEERDRLMGELSGVNPDAWAGADVIRQQARGADRVWDAVAAQLPKRRRGRRGGRGDEPETGGPDQAAPADVIIGERDHTDERENTTAIPASLAADGAGDGQSERPAGAASTSDAAGADVPEPAAADVHEPG